METAKKKYENLLGLWLIGCVSGFYADAGNSFIEIPIFNDEETCKKYISYRGISNRYIAWEIKESERLSRKSLKSQQQLRDGTLALYPRRKGTIQKNPLRNLN